jgi:outer membrane biosynthesis protein TonB
VLQSISVTEFTSGTTVTGISATFDRDILRVSSVTVSSGGSASVAKKKRNKEVFFPNEGKKNKRTKKNKKNKKDKRTKKTKEQKKQKNKKKTKEKKRTKKRTKKVKQKCFFTYQKNRRG